MPFPSRYYKAVPMVDCKRMSRQEWYIQRRISRSLIKDLKSRQVGMSDPSYNGHAQNRILDNLSWARYHAPRITFDRDTAKASGKWYDARTQLQRRKEQLRQEAQSRKWVEEALKPRSKNRANEQEERAA